MPMTAPWRLPVAGTSAYCDWRREAVDRARAWRFTPVPPAVPPHPARRRDPSELFLPAFRAPSGCAGTPRQTARWPSKRLNRH